MIGDCSRISGIVNCQEALRTALTEEEAATGLCGGGDGGGGGGGGGGQGGGLGEWEAYGRVRYCQKSLDKSYSTWLPGGLVFFVWGGGGGGSPPKKEKLATPPQNISPFICR